MLLETVANSTLQKSKSAIMIGEDVSLRDEVRTCSLLPDGLDLPPSHEPLHDGDSIHNPFQQVENVLVHGKITSGIHLLSQSRIIRIARPV
jgi:hypothetical protein